MLDDDDAPFGSDDDALRRNRAVADIGHGLVEDGHGRHELTQDTDGGVEFDREQVALVCFEHLREPGAAHAIGHDREAAAKADAADGGARRVPEGRQRVHPLAQGELERRHVGELFFQLEDLDGVAFRAHRLEAGAQTIFESHIRLRRRWGRGVWDHGSVRRADFVPLSTDGVGRLAK